MERLQRMAMGTGTDSSAAAGAVGKRGGKTLATKVGIDVILRVGLAVAFVVCVF